jgi:hypothetical protein
LPGAVLILPVAVHILYYDRVAYSSFALLRLPTMLQVERSAAGLIFVLDSDIRPVHETFAGEPYYIHPGATICPYPCPYPVPMSLLILDLHNPSLHPATPA